MADAVAFVAQVKGALGGIAGGGDSLDSAALGTVVELAEAQASAREASCAKTLETCLRTILCEYLSSSSGTEADEEASWQRVSILLDSTLWLLGQEKVAHNAFMLLLEDLAEEASLTLCEKLFQYIETKKPEVLAVGKNRLYLLRTCNKLLKRLSREDNPLLCGRLLILVATLLPLSERSGVNLAGGFDIDNRTEFAELEQGCTDESGRLVDVDLYNSLWRVQGLLGNPPLILESTNWPGFESGLRRVLEAFDRTSTKQGSAPQDLSAASHDAQSLKYSTSPNLLGLQLHDASFKCAYLFQALAVLSYLRVELPLKKPPATQSRDERALRQRQADAIPRLEAAVEASLKKFTPRVTLELIRTFIQREKHWILWKKVGRKAGEEGAKAVKCPPLEREALPEDLEMFKERKDALAEATVTKKGAAVKRKRASMTGFSKNQVKLGNEDLDRLWNISSDNHECLDFEDQEKVPKMSELVQRVVNQAQSDSGVDEADKLMCDKLYCWRVKRLLAQMDCKNFIKHCDKNLERLLPEVFEELREQMPVKEEEKEEEKEEAPGTTAAAAAEEDAEMKEAGEEDEGGGAKAEENDEVKSEGKEGDPASKLL